MNKNRVRTARPVAKLREGKTDWFRIENAVTLEGTASVYIYDEIGYWGVTASDFVSAFAGITAPSIDLHVNSPGGEVYDGIAIHTAIQQHPATVTAYVDGLAASAASFIVMAADKVVIAKNAEMMIHDAMGLCIGNAADMTAMVADLDRISNNIASMYADKTGGTPEDWRAVMLADNGAGTWYSASEAVAAGLADEILADGSDSGTIEDKTASFDLSVFAHFHRDDAPAPLPVDPAPFTFDPEAFREAFKEAK